MTNEQQDLLERLLGSLLLKSRDLKVTTYDRPEVIDGREVLLRLDDLSIEGLEALEDTMAEHGGADFGFAANTEACDKDHILILGAKATEQTRGKDGTSETTCRDLWRFGRIRHDGTTYTFTAKVYDVGSQYGIKGGRISKLQVNEMVTKKVILRYDRGWDIRPSTANAKAVLKDILAAYPEV